MSVSTPRHLWLLLAAAAVLGTACGGSTPPIDGDGGPDSGMSPDGGLHPDSGMTPDGGDGPPGDGGVCAPWAAGLQVGTAGNDEFLDLVEAPNGDLLVVGYVNGHETTDNSPVGDSRAVVGRISSSGKVLGSRYLDTDGSDAFEAALVDGDRLTLVGRTTGAIAGATPAGKFDAVLATVDLALSEQIRAGLQWGDERPQRPRRVARAADGALFIAGYDDVYIPTNYVESWEESTLSVASGRGTEAEPFVPGMHARLGNEGPDWLFGLALAADDSGDVFVTGQHASGPLKGAVVRRVSRSEVQVWATRIDPLAYDHVAAAVALPDGTLVVSGSTFMQIGDRAFGGQDIFVAWLDAATGEILRTGQAGSSDSDWAMDLAVDARGQVFVTGYTYGDLATQNAGMADAIVVSFDADGKWIGAWQHGSSEWDEPAAIVVDACGHVLVAGHTDGELVREQRRGARDAFLLDVVLQPR